MSSFPGLNTTPPLFRYHDLCQVQTPKPPRYKKYEPSAQYGQLITQLSSGDPKGSAGNTKLSGCNTKAILKSSKLPARSLFKTPEHCFDCLGGGHSKQGPTLSSPEMLRKVKVLKVRKVSRPSASRVPSTWLSVAPFAARLRAATALTLNHCDWKEAEQPGSSYKKTNPAWKTYVANLPA